MEKILISVPSNIVARFRAAVPPRQRSKFIANLLKKEVERCEKKLYLCALAVEQDKKLSKEMEEWDITVEDGLDND